MEEFCGGTFKGAHVEKEQKEVYNFVEVTRLPNKFDCVSLKFYNPQQHSISRPLTYITPYQF